MDDEEDPTNKKTNMKAFAISAVLVTTLFGITRLEAQKNTPRSVQSGNQSVVVSLSNTTTRNLSVLWVDFDGKAQNFGALAPGQTMKTQTYPGHLWQLSDGNNIFGTYRATTAATQQFATLQGTTPPAGVVQNTPQRMPQQRTSTTDQVVGGLLQKLIDKKTGRTTQNPVTTTLPAGTRTNPTPPAATATNITNTGSSITVAEAKQMIDYHNQVRREVGVGGVTWSPQIAQFAQQWADQLASTGKFAHRPNSQQKYGENLAGGMGYANPVMKGLQGWYGEKKLYRPAGAPFSMQLMPAGHYTQMVWRGTTQIGAGKAVCRTGQYRGWTIIVCNYNPRGNMLGQPAY